MKLILLIALLCALSAELYAKTYTSEGQEFKADIVLETTGVIWGFDFLPNGTIIYTKREGSLHLYNPKTKKTAAITGLPKIKAKGQGGLLDVKLHPSFNKNNWVYFTYSKPIGSKATTALGRAQLKNNKLVGFKNLFSAHEANSNSHHFGSRIAFDHKGHVFFSIGDRGKRHLAQKVEYHNGSILRLNEDGTIPKDNPYLKNKKALPELWSVGHRNPQGLFYNLETNELWECEFGPKGGDELNLIKPGKNYGWPIITYGREYYGPKIGDGYKKSGMEQPIVYYTPSISPSGMTIYTGSQFPKWKGNVFLANLSGTHLRRIVLKNKKVVKQEVLLDDLSWRFRFVRQGLDGNLYFSTDSGKIVRLIK